MQIMQQPVIHVSILIWWIFTAHRGALCSDWVREQPIPIMAKVVYTFYRFIILSIMTSKTFSSSTTRRGLCKNVVVSSSPLGEEELWPCSDFLDYHWSFYSEKKLPLASTVFSVIRAPQGCKCCLETFQESLFGKQSQVTQTLDLKASEQIKYTTDPLKRNYPNLVM